MGGSPLRLVRLTAAGAALVDGWLAGRPVGPAPAEGRLAGRLTDGGLLHPRPGPAADRPASRVAAAVVIPVRDDAPGAVATAAAFAGRLPVLVVDDGSAVPVTGPPGVGVLRRAASGGPAAARNEGWRRCDSEIVVFADAGCLPDPGCLDLVLAHFADPAVGAVAPRVTSRPAPGARQGVVRYELSRSPLDMGVRPAPVRPGSPVSYVPAAVLAVRRRALVACGGFDEALRYGEDVDLVWRLHGAGWRVRYEPAATASHPCRVGWGEWMAQRRGYGRSAAPLAARHGRQVAPFRASPWSVAVWGLLLAGRPGAATALAAGSAGALARKAPDGESARTLARAALTGHLRTGPALAAAVRRAWLPLLLLPVRHRSAVAALVALAPGGADWLARRPGGDPIRWVAATLADDLAYQSGVWAGIIAQRSPAALLPGPSRYAGEAARDRRPAPLTRAPARPV